MAANKVLRTINPKTDGYVPDKLLDVEVEDQVAVRAVTVEDGRKFIIRAKDPYGMWQIQTRRGSVPQMLSGLYTTQGKAEQAIIEYCAKHPSQTRPYNIS